MKTRDDLGMIAQRLGMLAALLLVAVVVISAVTYKSSSKVMQIHISIDPLDEGMDHAMITEKDVRKALADGFYQSIEGSSVAGIDAERVELVIEREPFIRNAEVFIDARNEMRIRVSQRIPIVHVIDANDLHYYLDVEGKKMPRSKHFTPRVMVASGHIPPFVPDFQEREKHQLHGVFALAMDIQKDPFLLALVEQIYVNEKGDMILAPKVGDQTIVFGSYKNTAKKIKRLKTFYQSAMPYVGWQKHKQLDLRFKNQVVARR